MYILRRRTRTGRLESWIDSRLHVIRCHTTDIWFYYVLF